MARKTDTSGGLLGGLRSMLGGKPAKAAKAGKAAAAEAPLPHESTLPPPVTLASTALVAAVPVAMMLVNQDLRVLLVTIHLALHELATKVLPQYEADDGALTATQLRQIRASAPKAPPKSVRSSLFGTDNT